MNCFCLAFVHRRTTPSSSCLLLNRIEPETPITISTFESDSPPLVVFPGGGIYFYWQAGVVTYLREQGYSLDRLAGASAGSLTATLAATQVDYYEAAELALQMASDANVWSRKGGLQGIWGPLIYDWLDQLLPSDACAQVQAKDDFGLLVTRVPSFTKERISTFRDRTDLIRCSMASVHIPWFLDSSLCATFRDQLYIDGSFLSSMEDYLPHGRPLASPVLLLDHKMDPRYRNVDLLSFIKAVTPNTIYQMMDDGRAHGKVMDEQGLFRHLSKL